MKIRHACALLLVFLVITSTLNMTGILDTGLRASPVDNTRPDEYQLSESEGALWNVTFDAGDSERPYRVFSAQDGGYFVLYSEERIPQRDHRNVSIMKIDEYGGQVWNRSVHAIVPELIIDAADMISTSDGGYTVLLCFWNSTSVARSFQLFHLDAECSHLWNRTVPLGSQEYVTRVLESANGDYILFGAGRFENVSMSFNVPLVVRTDSAGTLLWNNTYAHLQPTFAVDFAETSSGDIILCTRTTNIYTHFSDYLIMSIGSNGVHKWNTTLDIGDSDSHRSSNSHNQMSFYSGDFLTWCPI